jgi:DNA replication protein DnaC
MEVKIMTDSPQDLTAQWVDLLATHCDPKAYATYIKPLAFVLHEGQLHVFAPNRYLLSWVQTHCHETLQTLLAEWITTPVENICYRVGLWQEVLITPEDAHTQRLLDAGVPERYVKARFAEVYQAYPRQVKNLKLVKAYAADFTERTPPNLIFCGGVGVGKTHLACSLVSELMTHGVSCHYTRITALIRRFQSTYSSASRANEHSLLARYVHDDFLVIDELGLQRQTEASQLILSDVLCERFDALKPTLLVSNLPLKGTAQAPGLSGLLGTRLGDRLTGKDSLVLGFDWPSYRQSKKTPVSKM